MDRTPSSDLAVSVRFRGRRPKHRMPSGLFAADAEEQVLIDLCEGMK
jgi:hypothetical protein